MIHSKAALSYVEAQTRMDDERVSDEITVGLRQLNSLAKIMRARRFERGALALASPEVKFEMDSETLDPLDVAVYQVSPTCLSFPSPATPNPIFTTLLSPFPAMEGTPAYIVLCMSRGCLRSRSGACTQDRANV